MSITRVNSWDSTLQSHSVSCFHVILGLPGPCFPSTCMFSPSEWGPDPQCQTAQVAHWTGWWQCLAAWHCRSDHCPVIPLQTLEVWLCQWSSLTGMEHCALHTRAVHAATCPERKVAGRENWQQLLALLPGGFYICCGWKFTATGCWEHVSWVAKGSYHLQLVRSNLDFPLWSAIQGACSSLAPCTSVIRVLCQALEPTAFLVHPVLAAIAEDAVAAHSSVTDGTWKLTCSAGGPGPYYRLWSLSFLHLLAVLSPPLLLPCQEPPDTFLEQFSDDNKVIGREVHPGDPRMELSWQCFKHNDEEQRAEYQALVNTDLHFKLFTAPLTNTDMAPCISIHPLYQSHNPLLHTKFSQRPPDDFPRHSIKHLLQVYESHIESLVGS